MPAHASFMSPIADEWKLNVSSSPFPSTREPSRSSIVSRAVCVPAFALPGGATLTLRTSFTGSTVCPKPVTTRSASVTICTVKASPLVVVSRAVFVPAAYSMERMPPQEIFKSPIAGEWKLTVSSRLLATTRDPSRSSIVSCGPESAPVRRRRVNLLETKHQRAPRAQTRQ